MKKILIVDDNPVSLMITDNMLAGRYHTFCAASAEQAIELCSKGAPDLLLCDLLLPEMTGVELYKTLQEKTGAEFPLIIMTADDNKDFDANALDDATDVIHKPFEPRILLLRVDKALRNFQKTTVQPQVSAKRKILIVDDMIVSLMITENMLDGNLSQGNARHDSFRFPYAGHDGLRNANRLAKRIP